ncbi:cyclic lactone autoinducer peptide [Clostridium sp. AWRP]|nr:cyclic lactone autoinducer peptide [Clostridium sp. AWRP]AZV57718.1 cyclic lactone autoinducer peptide [Clostridium sp. AWRP]
MKNLKKSLLSKTMKTVGSLSLFLAAIVITPTSLGGAHQPKCPDEFLK